MTPQVPYEHISLRGMSDNELERACEARCYGAAQWAHWTSEIYSFGKCLRYWTGYPTFLPLFIYSDHGAGLHSHLSPQELNNDANVHLTWRRIKAERYKGFAGKEVLQIIHPWVAYRRQRGITRSPETKGTLVFYSHGTPDVKWLDIGKDAYFEELRALPGKFQPVVICLHMHDINAGLHRELRRYGFPIVTAGNTMATGFVDNFYALVKDFSYGTSPGWGSQVAYCVELGMPYFFMGEQGRLLNISDSDLPEGVAPRYWDSFHERLDKEAETLFSARLDSVTPEQRVFAESMLGVDSKLGCQDVRKLLWREFFRNWRRWNILPRSFVAALLSKLGILPHIKAIRNRLKSNRAL